MGCCDNKRSAMRTAPVGRSVSVTAPTSGRSVLRRKVSLRYLRREAIRVRGAASGRLYVVPAGSPELVVDSRDAAGLVKTGYFSF